MTPKEKIEALYEGLGFFYPNLVYGPDAPTNSQDKIEYEGRTVSKKEFLNIVFEFTKTNDITHALKKLLELKEGVQEIKPEKQPDRTTPENLEELVEEREKEKAEAKNAEERAQRQAKTEQGAEQIKEALRGKVVYAEPKDTTQKVQPTPQEEYALKKLTESAIKNRRVFVSKLSEQIIKNASPEIKRVIPFEQLELSAKQIALDFSERLIYKTPVAPPGVFASITDPATNLEGIIASLPAVDQIRKAGVTFSALSEGSDFTARTLLYPVLGENVTSLVYGPAQATYTVTFEPTNNTAYTVNLSELHDNATDFQSSPIYQSLNNPLVDIAKEKLISFGKDTFISQLNKLPKEGALGFISRFSSSGSFDSAISLLTGSQTQYVATNIVGKFVTTFLPQYTEIIGGVANFLKLNIGLAPVVASAVPTTAITTGVLTAKAVAAGVTKPAATIAGGAISTAIGKGVTAVAIKLGLSATLAATLGSVAPIVGHAIGFILGWLAGKLLSGIINWAKKHQDDLKIIGAIILGAGVLLRSLPLMVMGGLIFVPLAIGGGISMAGVGAGLFLFFRRLGKSMVITIGVPVIVTIIAFPILVAIILFIINSGAYIVPPSVSPITGIVESTYLKVDKIAVPAGPFKNSDLPLTIKYIIKITAKKSTITNIRVENTYTISQTPLIAAPPQIDLPDMPESISPTTPYSFSYEVVYDQNFKDSIVADNFKIIADTPGSKDNVAVGVATIVIGTPPEDCPSNWPVLTDQGQKYFVMQGPHAACTHGGSYPDREAIDVQVYPPDRSIAANDLVIATHKGNIVSIGMDGWGGLYVDILGSCGGQSFRSRHVHFSAFSSGLSRGSLVNKGIILGIMGKTGSAYKPHDHYEFREAQRGGSDASGNPPVKMILPFIPKRVPNGCCGDCNVFIP